MDLACLLNDASYLLVLFGAGVTVEVSFPQLTPHLYPVMVGFGSREAS
jgi:hypothetical protein